jgi:Na+-driven multidrug efflux pump
MSDAPVTQARIFRFWLPLAATWLMMAAEGPFLAAVIARLADPIYNLAAYGVAFSLALVVEAPVIMLMSAATALARNRLSYLRLRTFTHILNAAITLAMGIALLPPVFNAIAFGLIGLPTEVASLTHIALLILLPWPAAIGIRRLYQGVLIRHGLARRVAYGTVVRLTVMCGTAFLLARHGGIEGAWVGAAALTMGVSCEAVASRLMVAGTLRNLMGTPGAAAGAASSWVALSRFYYPLALTTLLSLGIHPVVTFFVGNSRSSLESLAVLPVIGSLVFIFRSLGLAYQEVVIVLIGDNHEGYAPLRTFGIWLSVGVTVGLSLIAWTPLAGVWFRVISGLSPELASFALTPIRILALIPGLTALLCFQRAIMVVRNTTNSITWATIIEVVGVVVVMWISISYLDAIGAVAAAAALLIGRIGANMYLTPAMKERGVRRGA